ncbi:MAG TPA: hypothetical protein VGN13_09495 [Solirubrobacteraceae bacterium]|jgi:hypothetical protein
MGLLDEAIREHLDLKRRNGGDPGEIARKENEALTPVLEAADGPDADADVTSTDDQYVAGAPEAAGAAGAADLAASADDEYAADEYAADEETHAGEREATYSRASLADAAEADAALPPVSGEFAQVGEETAELDMEAVLGEPAQPPAPEPPDPAFAARPVRATAPAEGQDDALEWELPGDRDAEGIPHEIPGQERLTFE